MEDFGASKGSCNLEKTLREKKEKRCGKNVL